MDRCLSSLSVSRKKLLQTMRLNPFSTIEVIVAGNEPLFSPPPTVTREIKLGIDSPPPAPNGTDFGLKRAVIDLFEHFDRLRDDTTVTIEVRHGLPARLILAGEV